MKNTTKTVTFLSCVITGAALLWMSIRPCEPVAQGAENEPTIQVPEITIVADPIPDISENTATTSKNLVLNVQRPMAKALSALSCTDKSPAWHCWSRPLDQGTDNTSVQVCDCSTY